MKRIAILLFMLAAFTCGATAQNNAAVPPGQAMLTSPAAFADQHLAALDKHGPCPLHRRSFRPVAQTTLPWDNPLPC